MKYPEYRSQSRDTYMISNFGGYNGRERIADYEFSHMENMSSHSYPLLRPRERRGIANNIFPAPLGGFVADGPTGEVYGIVTGTANEQNNLTLYGAADHKSYTIHGIDGHNGEERQFAGMGADVIMFPDKVKLSFSLPESASVPRLTRTPLENETVTVSGLPDGWEGSVGYWYVDPAKVNDGDNDGIIIPETTWASREPPEDPENGQWWLDNSHTMDDPYGKGVGLVRRYSATQGTWVDIYPTYVKMRFPGIGKGFKVGDYVNISQEQGASGALRSLFGDRVIAACGDDYIVVSGSVANTEHISSMISSFAGITVKRSVPDLDYITEAGNRLWGCRNEYRDGKIINEIYVSALGDPTNWSKYDGITSDSYAVTIGIGGAFTGAATYNDVPHFFKENAIIKVYGNAPSNYETVALRCDGVEEGSSRSIASVDGRLFYKSARGLMVYGGGYPSLLTDKFGSERYRNAVGGELFGRYYVSMEDSNDERHLFVYDTESGLLHREDDLPVSLFLRTKSKLIALTVSPTVINPDSEELEGDVKWHCETGDMGLDDPDNKYFSRIRIRADVPRGAYFTVSFRYNGRGAFTDSVRFNGEGLGTSTYMVRPARCDTLQMRFTGEGDVRIYSVTYNYERGTDAG